MLNQNHANALVIDEAFEPYIKRVLETHSFGVGRGHIELNYATSSGKKKADRFNLLVPYAGHTLEWTVMFNSSCPDLGPDFEFHNDSFLSDPNVDTIENHIPSLAKWRPSDPECLLNVLIELTCLYKQHQIELLATKEHRLSVEYELIVNEAGVRPEDVEVFLSPNESTPTETRFFIRLDIDFSRLPGRSNKATEDQAMLVVTFQHNNCSRISPQLYLSIPLEATFGGPGNLHLPPFPRERCIMDYLPEVKNIIDGKIQDVVHHFEMKRQFIAAVLLMRRRNVIEYDAINFTRITILLEHQDFYFLVHIGLPPGFPKDQPNVGLQSIYHMTQKDELVRKEITSYPYCPHWSAPEMVTKMMTRIIDKEVGNFKQMSVKSHNCR